jgi:hypothetical protein
MISGMMTDSAQADFALKSMEKRHTDEMSMEDAVASLEKSSSRLSKSKLSADIKALIADAAPKQKAVLLGLKGQVG